MHTFHQQAPNPTAAPVDVTLQVGTLAVEAWDKPQVEVEARLNCGAFFGARCRKIADSIRLRVSPDESGRIIVRFDGWPQDTNRGMQGEITLRMPRGARLVAQMGVGKTEISGIEGDVSAEIGVGRVRIEMPERAACAVYLQTGVGSASLVTASGDRQTRAPLGAQLGWRRGKGPSKVNASCGVGQVRVALG